MKCELYTDDQSRLISGRCGEQATLLWVPGQHELPIPCCAYHAWCCTQGEMVSLAQSDASQVTFQRFEAHA